MFHLFFFSSQKRVWLISNPVVAVALYMLRMSHLSFLPTDVQIRIDNSVFFFFFLHKMFIERKFKNMNASHEFIIIRLFSGAFCLWHWQHCITLLAFLSSTILLLLLPGVFNCNVHYRFYEVWIKGKNLWSWAANNHAVGFNYRIIPPIILLNFRKQRSQE